MSSIVIQGDTSGSITVQAPSVAGTNTLNLQASSGTLATTAQASVGTKNLIINGDMRIDQRNGGASVTPSNQAYVLDRWKNELTQASKFSIQQVTDAPQGAINSLKITSLSAYSVISTDQFNIANYIEGNMISHLNWGSSNAKTVTLSFWVKSSLTGTFSGALNNASGNRSYAFEYTILSANTWEQKSITIAGDITGTWLTDTGLGIRVCFSLGCGSTITGTANTWTGSFLQQATGATSLLATNGATLQLSLVQLEIGDTATPFENRMYSTELAMCQRYYWKIAEGSGQMLGLASYYTSGGVLLYVQSPSPMRNTPTVDQVNGTDYYGFERNGAVDGLGGSFALYRFNGVGCQLYTTSGASGTAGQSGVLWTNNAASYIALTAEL